MTVSELYAFLNEKIPPELSCNWDNDGLMCCSRPDREVRRVLVALDMTERVIDEACRGEYDVIVSHHPLIFHPLKALNPGDLVAKKAIRLLVNGIAAMSFHTRLDAVAGGVNDTLANALGLTDVVPFGENGESIGRVGVLSDKMPISEFALLVKRVTGADSVQYSDAGIPAHRIALVGGGGSSELCAAARTGADTFVSGELKHDQLTDAPDRGMNLIAAGHFYTENPVCETIRDLLLEADASLTVTLADSNPVRTV